MHVEIKYAQNFVLNFLYNKLPRRRVNLFGEELESALRDKFRDHWYPDKPFKGSAFRCLKITDPLDPVLNRAAHESGNPIHDIIENLPSDLAIWIDPGEVSYRIGEKGSVKILYSENDGNPYIQSGFFNGSRESTEDLSPEIVGFLQGENLSGLTISRNNKSSSPSSPFTNNPTFPITYTAGMFAQTKFGSTKLKTSGKKTSRMSPTEFSNYIKTRAALQKQQQHHHPPNSNPFNAPSSSSRSSLLGAFHSGGNNRYTEGYSFPEPIKNNHPPPSHHTSSASSTSSSSSWTCPSDPETEAFLQDIFSVGLKNTQVGGNFPASSNNQYAYELVNNPILGASNPSRPDPKSHHSFKPQSNSTPSPDKYQHRVLVAN